MKLFERTGGQQAWRAGYCGISPLSFEIHDDWYYESYDDGARHARDEKAAEAYRAAQVKSTKEIRAKFKAIRAGKWL